MSQELICDVASTEITPVPNFIYQLNQIGNPLTRKDMLHETGNQAIVPREDLEILGGLEFIHISGERMLIELDSLHPDDVFILYPHEVGDEEREC